MNPMKTIGLIGGTTWLSTMDYYRIINEEVNRQLGGLHSARLLIHSVDFHEIKSWIDKGEWTILKQRYTAIIHQLHTAGAEAIVLCANTPHLIVPELTPLMPIPIIHIADVTAAELRTLGIGKAALLGTRITMEAPFFRDKLSENHISVLVPEADDRLYIHDTVFEELAKGILLPVTRSKYQKIIKGLIVMGAEAVILGCTEIPLLIKPEDCPVPLLDTTLIHAKAAARYALH